MAIPKRKPRLAPMPKTEDLVRDLIDNPDQWLDTANDQLGGKKPKEFLGTSREPVLRSLLESIRQGSFS